MTDKIISGTMPEGVPIQVQFDDWTSTVEIVNSGAAEIWARTDGVNPTIAGPECIYIPARSYVIVTNALTEGVDIRMISPSTSTYTVSAGV